MHTFIATTIDALRRGLRHAADETAEGVISTAIAVLILAFVGAGMFVAFQNLADSGCQSSAGALEDAMGAGASVSCE